MNAVIKIPLSIYIHIPWCVQKCPYCDFNSHALKISLPADDYVDALLRDLTTDAKLVGSRKISSIFIGGGTPSLLSGKHIARIIGGVKQQLNYQNDLEVTLEANPGTLESASFADFLTAGVNRLSIGVQSFDPQQLKFLGRIHSSDEATLAIERAKLAGFTNINLDLMYGLANQTTAQALKDLKTAIAQNTTHLSWYQLTLEPNTLFYRKPPQLPSTDLIRDMEIQGRNLLAKSGFNHYEVSAYAKNQHQCQHNLNYWTFADYLGIGAGAHSKITCLNSKMVQRQMKYKHPKQYLNPQLPFAQKTQILATKDLIFEFMLNALRLQTPLDLSLFNTRTLLNPDVLTKPLAIAEAKGLVSLQQNHLRITELGANFLDDLVSIFL
jgi:oxygen-independent coproporphyrinogen-3 oxidase